MSNPAGESMIIPEIALSQPSKDSPTILITFWNTE